MLTEFADNLLIKFAFYLDVNGVHLLCNGRLWLTVARAQPLLLRLRLVAAALAAAVAVAAAAPVARLAAPVLLPKRQPPSLLTSALRLPNDLGSILYTCKYSTSYHDFDYCIYVMQFVR